MKIFINKLINNFYELFGNIFGQIYKSYSLDKKRNLIDKIGRKIPLSSQESFGRKYFFYYTFLKALLSNENELFVIQNLRNDLKINLNIKEKTQRQIFLMRPYEKNITNFIFSNLRLGDIFIDIGANIGYYTLLASRLVGDNGGVISFEPEKNNFDNLIKNIQINNLKNVQKVNMAVGEKESSSNLYLNPLNEGGHSLLKMDLYSDNSKSVSKEYIKKIKPEFKDTQQVNITSLDDYLSKHPNIEKISLVKIDVEGYEREVLQGMKNTLSKHKIENIICEVSKDNSSVFAFLKQFNYHPYLLSKEGKTFKNTHPDLKSSNYLFK